MERNFFGSKQPLCQGCKNQKKIQTLKLIHSKPVCSKPLIRVQIKRLLINFQLHIITIQLADRFQGEGNSFCHAVVSQCKGKKVNVLGLMLLENCATQMFFFSLHEYILRYFLFLVLQKMSNCHKL